MPRALFIGGTRFIGLHAVETFLDADYDVTLFNRGNHENPFADRDAVGHRTGDRKSDAALKQAREAVDPDVVVDFVAYYPGEVRAATDIFADVDAYVYISSGSAYEKHVNPKREGEAPLRPCSDEAAVDDSMDTYGARKAEGDRAVFEAATEGVRAMSVRPTIVYGPYDYTARLDYWIDRVTTRDRVLVPGDGTHIHHLVAVENVARALLTVAEKGAAGAAYNVGDRTLLTLADTIEAIADAAETAVEVVPTSPRELADGDIEPTDFPLYGGYPHVLATQRLADLGWDPVDPRAAIAETVAADYETDRSPGPDRAAEEQVLDGLDPR